MILKTRDGQKFSECPVCGSARIKFKLNTFDRHYLQHQSTFDLYKCKDCKLLFLNPMITELELHNLYPEDDYYAYAEIRSTGLHSNKGFLKKVKSCIINTSSRDPDFNNVFDKSVLDVGCGSGEKLLEFKNSGWKGVYGVEINKRSCEVGNENGINIYNGTLTEANFPRDFFDYIRSNHSFEHIINNKEILKEMFRICKPGGKLFIGVPNTKSLNYKLFKKFWYYLGVPFHPFSYNPKNLSLLIENEGFKIETVHYNGNALGILGSLQIVFNSIRGIQHSKGFLINKFFEIPVHQLARLLNFFRYGDCIEIIAVKPTISN